MKNANVAIVGSAEPNRNYEEPVIHHAKAEECAEAIGRALAKKGYRITVYDGSPKFIEAAVVRGFASESKAPQSIEHYEQIDPTAVRFPEQQTKKELFKPVRISAKEWDVGFYQSLLSVDAVLLIGGSGSALRAGAIAMARRIPLLALSGFGGRAYTIWSLLQNDQVSAQMKSDMGGIDPGDAEKWVDLLEAQANAAIAAEAARSARKSSTHRRLFLAASLIVAWVVACGLMPRVPLPGTSTFLFVLLIPMIAGASGGLTRLAWLGDPRESAPRTCFLGLVGGTIAGILYLIGQWSTRAVLPGAGPESVVATSSAAVGGEMAAAFILMASAGLTGFISGFAFDRLFKRIDDGATLDQLK